MENSQDAQDFFFFKTGTIFKAHNLHDHLNFQKTMILEPQLQQ